MKTLIFTAKITPKKIGQFVSVWKRNKAGVTQPRELSDDFNFLVIVCEKEHLKGQFTFPKEILAEKGIVSTSEREGKRGFRVYPPWDKPENKQAIKSQEWQVEFFKFD